MLVDDDVFVSPNPVLPNPVPLESNEPHCRGCCCDDDDDGWAFPAQAPAAGGATNVVVVVAVAVVAAVPHELAGFP